MGNGESDIKITTDSHNFEEGDILEISGSGEYDGKWIVHKVGIDYFINKPVVVFGKTRAERRGKKQVAEKYYRRFAKGQLNYGR